MQYPVPQFTDVEDKLIGVLSLKQFAIVFAAGIVVFVFYSLTKSVAVLVVVGILIGVPALALAFGKVNGRPIYKMVSFMIRSFTQPKLLVFHKEVRDFDGTEQIKNVEIIEKKEAPMSRENTQDRLRQVNKILQEKSEEETRLIKDL